jgi:outer membrane protein OmpA-like peptidoglycan-associated protein
MRNVVLILSLLLWLIFGWWSCNNDCCTDVAESMSNSDLGVVTDSGDSLDIAAKKDVGPLLFMYNSNKAITDAKWAPFKDEIASKLQDNQQLEITGLYRNDEVNSTTFSDLGIARAEAVKELLGIDSSRVKVSSRLEDGASDKENPFEAYELDYRVVTENIIETEDKTVIRFPFNSTKKLNSVEVEDYLDNVAKRVIASGEKIILTGHADNVGDDASNLRFGQLRADVIKDYLISKGVDPTRITSTSEGKSKPIADNTTESGRQENRRTELQIIK